MRRSVFSSGANMTEQINEESCAYLLVWGKPVGCLQA